MATTKTYTIYPFDELSDAAKEKARDWYRSTPSDDWWDSVYEDAIRMAEILGIEIDYRIYGISRTGGQTHREPKIWFSGFSSQGDGACWEGSYRYKKGAAKAIAKEAPADYEYSLPDGTLVKGHSDGNAELLRIALGLQETQRKHFYRLEATVTHRGHYYHSGCMSVDVSDSESPYRDIGDAEDDIKQLLRDFADWIYDQLEKEDEWLNSDEQVDENIRINEYTFDEDGNRED